MLSFGDCVVPYCLVFPHRGCGVHVPVRGIVIYVVMPFLINLSILSKWLSTTQSGCHTLGPF